MKRPPALPLRWQLTLWYLALLTLLLIALGVFLTLALDSFLTTDTRGLLQAQVRLVDDTLRAELPASSLAGIAPDLVKAANAPDVGVLVAAPNGTLLGKSNGPRDQPGFARLLLRASPSSRGPGRDSFGIVASDGARYAVLMHVLGDRGADVGAVQLSANLNRVDQTVRQFQLLFVAGGLAALALAGLIGGPITGWGLRPLQKVAATCSGLAAGDLSQRLRLPRRNDEIGTVAVAFDHMADRLEANFDAQRQFVADAAHELRTPLTAISGYTDLLLRGAHDDGATANQVLRTMLTEEDRMGHLVDDLLALARLEASAPPAHEDVDAAALASALAREAALLTPSLRVDYDGPPSAIVHAAPDELRQALLNLADNARKYTPAGGHVTFRVAAQDGCVDMSVFNSGPGIPAEALPHLFDRFYRADVSRARKTGGAGLGLAITRALIERQGGDIAVISDRLETRFTIRLQAGGGHGRRAAGPVGG